MDTDVRFPGFIDWQQPQPTKYLKRILGNRDIDNQETSVRISKGQFRIKVYPAAKSYDLYFIHTFQPENLPTGELPPEEQEIIPYHVEAGEAEPEAVITIDPTDPEALGGNRDGRHYIQLPWNGLPSVKISIPQLQEDSAGNESYDLDTDGNPKLKPTDRLVIGTLEYSFETASPNALKADWIEEDPDRFYVRLFSPSHSGHGPIKVRVWTDSEGTDYDDDARSTPAREVVELYEKDSTGVFTSKSMLLTSNDEDDLRQVDGIADNAINDRTRKIALGGKLKVELIEFKEAADYIADAEAVVPIEKTIKIKVWVAKNGGAAVISDAAVDTDFRRIKETMAQVGIKVERFPTTVKFEDSDAGVDLDNGLNIGTVYNAVNEAAEVFDWIALWSQRAADEISFIYVNHFKNDSAAGMSYIPKYNSVAKYANHAVIAAQNRLTYTAPHELLHILMNTRHEDQRQENAHLRMTFCIIDTEGESLMGRKRITKRTLNQQKKVIYEHNVP